MKNQKHKISLDSLSSRLAIVIYLLPCYLAFSQANKVPQVTPVPPAAFEFLKVSEIPISEYTGIANLEIPIYTIKEGDFSFPISLKYQGGGIRVTEEATWVGLGWNLSVGGNVTQVINDRDDFGDAQKILPDYYASYGSSYTFPPYSCWPWLPQTPPVPGCQFNQDFPKSNGISPSNPVHGQVVYQDFYIPINQQYVRNQALFNADGNGWDKIDSEPDVFKASFGGHHLEFIIDMKTAQLEILNKKNYKITQNRLPNGKPSWKIVTPDGVQYFFEELNETVNRYIETTDYFQHGGTSGSSYQSPDVMSRTWHLTKIITTVNRRIDLRYETAIVQDIPTFSQTLRFNSHRSAQVSVSNDPVRFEDSPLFATALAKTLSETIFATLPQTKSFLKTISFTQGSVNFQLSERSDLNGSRKIDYLVVNNLLGNEITRYIFAYDYFQGHSQARRTFSTFAENFLTKRLKLLSFQKAGEPPYQFSYDETPLPSKSGFARDFWGFYNGKNQNSSLLPNPIHIGRSDFGDNGNDTRANLEFARAGSLIRLRYPTGGITEFEYELNSFANTYYPDLTEGGGLRVRSIKTLTNNGIASYSQYAYEGGKMMSHFKVDFDYYYNLLAGYAGGQLYNTARTQTITANNFFVSSLFGSGNFIGYDRVIKRQLDDRGSSLGKVVSEFLNHRDEGGFLSASTASALPSRINHLYPSNGLIINQKMFNGADQLIKEVINTYRFEISKVFYGARTALGSRVTARINSPVDVTTGDGIVGFYPLYSGESLQETSDVREYENGDRLNRYTTYAYLGNHLLDKTTTTNSKGETEVTQYKYPQNSSMPNMATLVNRNMLDRPVTVTKTTNGNPIQETREYYSGFNNLMLISRITEKKGYAGEVEKVRFDSYDNVGNLLEVKTPSEQVAYLWAYNNSLPVAKIRNASNSQCVYTSFESEPYGRWQVSGSIVNGGRTGAKCFQGTRLTTTGIAIGDYHLSFWAKPVSSAQSSISGSINLQLNGDDWKYFTFDLRNVSSVTLDVTNLAIDELRLHPFRSQITTYTYEPLIGVTSITDENGRPDFFVYDEYNRLQQIKDARQNIKTAFDYSYKIDQ